MTGAQHLQDIRCCSSDVGIILKLCPRAKGPVCLDLRHDAGPAKSLGPAEGGVVLMIITPEKARFPSFSQPTSHQFNSKESNGPMRKIININK